MATRIHSPPQALAQSQPAGGKNDAPSQDDGNEGEPGKTGSDTASNAQKATGLLWRVTSGAVGGVLGVASSAASGVRWAATKGVEVGGAVVGTVSHKLPAAVHLPFAAKKKDKDE